MTEAPQPRAAPDSQRVMHCALAMAALGYPIYPVRLQRREDGKKDPTIPVGWRDHVSADPAKIEAWFKPDTRFNAYLIDCEKARIVVVDLDRGTHTDKITGEVIHRDGVAEWARIGGPQALMVVRTASGGEHHYFAATDDWAHSVGAGKAGLGVDIQGSGKCVFGPGSEVAPYDAHEPTSRHVLASARPLPVAQLSAVPASVIERGIEERQAVQAAERESRISARAYDVPANATAAEQAQARVEARWDELAAWEDGVFNTLLNKLSYEVGRWFASMKLGADEAETYVAEGMAVRPRTWAPDDKDWVTIRSGVRAGMANPWEANPDYRQVDDLIALDPGEAPASSSADAGALALLVAKLRGELLSPDGLKALPPPTYLIDKLIPEESLTRIYGASGSFKSFGVLGMAAAIGEGSDWHGYDCKQGDVIYIVAEGVRGMSQRVSAWERHHGRPMTGVHFLPRPLQLKLAEATVMLALVTEMRPAAVIFDTQARNTVGVDENSATEMGMVVETLNKMKLASGGAMILVHHSGHDAARSRGSSSVYAAGDTEIMFTRKDAGVVVDVMKQKDDEEVKGITLALAGVEGGSCVLMLGAALPTQRAAEDWDPRQPPEIGEYLETYEGDTAPVNRAVGNLARYMAHNATSGAGRRRSEAIAALRKSPKDKAVLKAWDVLLACGAIKTAPGHTKTGAAFWVDEGEREPL